METGIEGAVEGLPGSVVTRGGSVDQATGFAGLSSGALILAPFDAKRCRDDTIGTSLSEGRRYGIFQRLNGQGSSRNARA
jgi:hypothetical protein